ncbi:MAG: YdcF family protein [Acidimicrobiales bacterium]
MLSDGPWDADVAATRRSRRRLALRLAGAALVAGALYVLVTFVQVYRASNHDGARTADAIIVLGAAQYNGRPSPVLQDRLDHALALYEAQLARVIVVTGGRQEGDRFTEATTGYNYLRSRGVPDAALLKEIGGRNSYESLSAAARFLRDKGLVDVVLVTDGYHAFRVGLIAGSLGLDASVSPTDTRLSRSAELRQLVRETAAVSIGRVIGWNRLLRLDAAVND